MLDMVTNLFERVNPNAFKGSAECTPYAKGTESTSRSMLPQNFQRDADPDPSPPSPLVNEGLSTQNNAATSDALPIISPQSLSTPPSEHQERAEKSVERTSYANAAASRHRPPWARPSTNPLRNEISMLKRRCKEFEVENVRLQEVIKGLQHEASRKDVLMTEQAVLLETRGAELKTAQTYLIVEDKFVGADVVALIESLNEEIYQTAAIFIDKIGELQVERVQANGQENSRLLRHTNIDLGGTLRNLGPDDDPGTVVQSVLQHALGWACRHFISKWSLDGDDLDAGLRQMYSSIREQEVPAIAGRWRILSRSSAKYATVVSGDTPETHLTSRLISAMGLIFVISGYLQPNDDAGERIRALNLEPRLQQIAQLAIQLDKAMSEGVMSMDLKIDIVRQGYEFDEGRMEDVFDEPISKKRGKISGSKDQNQPKKRVFCTTALGLYSEAHPRSTTGEGNTGSSSTILLKTKVMAEVESSPLFLRDFAKN